MTSLDADAIRDPAAPSLTRPDSVRGRFLWYDLMVPDVDTATRFYPGVTGWSLASWPTADGVPPYVMWANGAVPVGGVMTPPGGESTAPYWIAYIGTPDVDATYAQALALGGRGLSAPREIPDVGRFAILADPQGATFAIFCPTTPSAPAAAMPAVGEFAWRELSTTDHAGAFAFYSQLFGWAPTQSLDMGSGGVYQMFGASGTTYGGMFDALRDAQPPHWLLYVRVDDMARALAAVRDGGGTVRNGPMPIPGGHVAHCIDVQGAHFAVHVAA